MPWSPIYATIEVFYGGGQFFLLEFQVFSPPQDEQYIIIQLAVPISNSSVRNKLIN